MPRSRLEITPMLASDIREVVEIERLSHPVPWLPHVFLGELERDWAHIDVVRAPDQAGQSRVVAFCNYWLVHDEVHLLNLATHPDWRRQGIGTLLVQHLVDVARAHACRYVTLEVRASNHAAQALYSAHGFTTVGVRPAYYQDNREDALVMTLDLGPEPSRTARS